MPMSTMREALRDAAEQNKGLAAIGGAFLAGGLVVSALNGAITQPRENAAQIEIIRSSQLRLEEKTDALVTFVETQALFNCTLIASVSDEISLQTCRDLPRVPR